MESLLLQLGTEIDSVDEEVFTLFAQNMPSNSLGFYEPASDHVSVTVGGQEYDIRQSSQLLKSARPGTTGAMLWQVTPRFARWMLNNTTVLARTSILTPDSVVIELGCGVAGLLGIALAPRVARYIMTDQDYVLKILRDNVQSNLHQHSQHGARSRKTKTTQASKTGNVDIETLDWEADDVAAFLRGLGMPAIDLVLACDCVYNDALVDPFVSACAEICKGTPDKTLCVIAQQLRSAEVFELWLTAFFERFHVWRMPDELVSAELGTGSGFVVHIGRLRV